MKKYWDYITGMSYKEINMAFHKYCISTATVHNTYTFNIPDEKVEFFIDVCKANGLVHPDIVRLGNLSNPSFKDCYKSKGVPVVESKYIYNSNTFILLEPKKRMSRNGYGFEFVDGIIAGTIFTLNSKITKRIKDSYNSTVNMDEALK